MSPIDEIIEERIETAEEGTCMSLIWTETHVLEYEFVEMMIAG